VDEDERTQPEAGLRGVAQWMTPQEHGALRTAVVVLLDHALQDVASLYAGPPGEVSYLSERAWLMAHLPRQYRARYDRLFVQRFLACLMTVAYKFAQAPWQSLSCVGEELAACAFIEDARTQLDIEGHPDSDDAFAELEDTIFEDMDFEFLFEGEYEGIEETEVAQVMGIGNLAFADWFKPFRDEVTVHPFTVG